ncbi:Tkl protein kinase, partial [Globisporangium splendens]
MDAEAGDATSLTPGFPRRGAGDLARVGCASSDSMQERVKGGVEDEPLDERRLDASAPDALHRAVASECVDDVQFLIGIGSCSVHDQDEWKRTPLSHATTVDMVPVLVRNGALATATDNLGETTLYTTASAGLTDVAQTLMALGSPVNVMSSAGRSSLAIATRAGHADLVKTLLDFGAYTDTKDSRGYTPLYYAASSGDIEVAQVLVQGGALVDAKNGRDRTALFAAANAGYYDVVNLLVKFGAEIDVQDCEGKTPLFAAALAGHPAVVTALIDFGASISARDKRRRTPLFCAASAGHADVVEILIQRGSSVNDTTNSGKTPILAAASAGHVNVLKLLLDLDGLGRQENYNECLLCAAKAGRSDTVKALLQLGASVHATDNRGKTPLLHAASDVSVVEMLLEYGASVDAKTYDGKNAVFYAANGGHADAIKVLAQAGASVSDKTSNGTTAIFAAASAGHADAVKTLIELGGSVQEKISDGRTPLIFAASAGHNNVVKVILEHGALVNGEDVGGRTPLIFAASEGHTNVVTTLLGLGASVHLKDPQGKTALYVAAEKGDSKVVATLLHYCASVDDKDTQGRTPLFAAVQHGHLDVMKILMNSGAAVNAKDSHGRTVLFVAAHTGDLGMVLSLIEYGASINDKDNEGKTTLFSIVSDGEIEVISALIKLGAFVDEEDHDGRTALFNATKAGRLDVVELLIRNGASPNSFSHVDRSRQGYDTPLILAGRAGYMGIFEALINAGASVNVRGDNGETPLISVSRCDYFTGVQQIMAHGCSISPGIGSKEEYPLIPSTLRTMATICAATREFKSMSAHFLERLEDVCSVLQSRDTDPAQDSGTLATFVALIFRFCRLLFQCSNRQSSLSRFIGSRAISSTIQDFHEELDHFCRLANLSQSNPTWRTQWEDDKLLQQHVFQETLSEDNALVAGLGSDAEQYNASVLLHYELQNRGGTSNLDVIQVIEDVLSRLLRVCKLELPRVPEWFASRDDVDFQKWNMIDYVEESIQHYQGKWLKTKVMIATSIMPLDEFHDAATKWYPLSHPNVLKMYGVCHISDPFLFIYEYYPEGWKLCEFLAANQAGLHSAWNCMYEASLGLQYLHQRNVIHGDLRGDNIVVGLDSKTKIAGFGETFVTNDIWRNYGPMHWQSPEVLRRESACTIASDMYAFGMCILEAVTLELPWSKRNKKRALKLVLQGELPERPTTFNDTQWDLITKMCAFDPEERVNIVYVVNQLKIFTLESEDAGVLVDIPTVTGTTKTRSIEEYVFPELGATISVALENVLIKCNDFPESEWMVEKVYTALAYIFDRLQQLQKEPTDPEVTKYCSILAQVQRYLCRAVSEKSVAQFARSRKVAEAHHVIYAELDRLLDMLGVSESDSIRSWERDRGGIEMRFLVSDSTDAEYGSRDQADKHEAISVTHFDSDSSGSNPDNSLWTQAGLSALNDIPSWYLPLRELVLGESDRIGQGAFGEVYKGTWLDTLIVVKFMGYEEDAGTISTNLLLHEIRIWYRLNHPHIVKLYGACHIDKRYFVCEYATNGDLQEFLKIDVNKKLTWQKMYEVALGLEYLHGQNIAHNDLKCDNVLIGMDVKAKLIDFGLSCLLNVAEIQVDVKRMGAVHWKSPEYLTGGRPSFASDVYSFAMCILEALTGDIPWGKQMSAVFVKFQVKKGKIPALPDCLNDKQRNLIELMTRKDPLERVKMSFVVDKLFEMSEEQMYSVAP